MKAIRVHQFGGPEVMKLEELPDLHPGPGEVVVRVKAVGVNPVDTYIRSGAYASKPALPYTPVWTPQALWKPWARVWPVLSPARAFMWPELSAARMRSRHVAKNPRCTPCQRRAASRRVQR